jgi:hypothetical protein
LAQGQFFRHSSARGQIAWSWPQSTQNRLSLLKKRTFRNVELTGAAPNDWKERG